MKKNPDVSARASKISYLLTLVYFASYLTRINFAVMLVSICADLGMEKSALSIVVVALTVSYGAGQIVSGVIGDRVRPTNLLTFGLSLAVLCNLALPLMPNVYAMAAVWGVNGFAQAMLWPPIVRIMSATMNEAEYSLGGVRVAYGSSGATVFLYLLCPLLLPHLGWRWIMACCAAGGVLILIFWLLAQKRLFAGCDFAPRPLPKDEAGGSPITVRGMLLPLIFAMAAVALQGCLRDGVTNWMPSYLLETFGLSAEYSILSTVVLAIFSVLSLILFRILRERIFRDEAFCAGVIFLGSCLFSLLLFLLNGRSMPVSTLLLSMITGCMHGANLMLVHFFPNRFARTGRISTVSGVINSCTYVGAAAATYGFARLSEKFGWGFTVGSWIVIAALGSVCAFLCSFFWKRKLQK